jgi:uncharacterized protein YkwD
MTTIYLPLVTGGQQPQPPPPVVTPVTPWLIILSTTNEARLIRGIAPLVLSQELVDAANYHAADMIAQDYYTHDSLDESWVARLTRFYPAWMALGENIAAGYRNEIDAASAWLNSTKHYENIINPAYVDIGIGHAHSDDGRSQRWVVDFGAKRVQP